MRRGLMRRGLFLALLFALIACPDNSGPDAASDVT